MAFTKRRARRQYRTPLVASGESGNPLLERRWIRRREDVAETRRFRRTFRTPVPGSGQSAVPFCTRQPVRRLERIEETRRIRRHLTGPDTAPPSQFRAIRRPLRRQEELDIRRIIRQSRIPLTLSGVDGGTFFIPRQYVRRFNHIEDLRRFRRRIPSLPFPESPDAERGHRGRLINRIEHVPILLRFHRRMLIRRILNTSAGPDSLRFYFTGAAFDGGPQASQSASLGNFRSSTEAARISQYVSTPIPNVQIIQAARINAVEDVGGVGLGTGTIIADSPNSLRYAAPGSVTPGNSQIILSGEIQTLFDGSVPSKWVRVTRTDSEQLAGGESLAYVDIFNDVFGMSDGLAAGGNMYRAVMLRNDFTATVSNLQLYVKPLIATNAVSSVTQLGGAGAGTITGVTDSFCGWLRRGWVRIESSVGVLKEIVYYSSRTDNALTVPALGRGRLGTVATAGAATDKIWSVPGVRIGFEYALPLVNGSVQVIANETTAPNTAAFVGTAWTTAITAATGIQAGTLNYQEHGALWIHRELPVGVSATARALNMIGVAMKTDGIPSGELLAGFYRIADAALEKYEIHIGVGAEPDLSLAPTETTASLPYDTTYTLPINTIVYVAVNFRNRYDLVSQNTLTTVIETDGTSNEISPVPLTPNVISWLPSTGGSFRVLADYDVTSDPNPGDNWRIYITTNGVDPTTADLVTTVPILRGGAFGRAYLDYSTIGYAGGTIGKIRLAIYRSSDGRLSALTPTYTAVAETAGPSQPSGVIGQKKSYTEQQ